MRVRRIRKLTELVRLETLIQSNLERLAELDRMKECEHCVAMGLRLERPR